MLFPAIVPVLLVPVDIPIVREISGALRISGLRLVTPGLMTAAGLSRRLGL